VRPSDTLFALHVRGDSMTGAGILDGDLVVVRQQEDANDGDIVVALMDDESATVKKLQRQGGQVCLVAMNPAHPSNTVAGERVRIQGRVIGVRRDLRAADAS
jgi:repressor LexA